jgi:hypothetical protein
MTCLHTWPLSDLEARALSHDRAVRQAQALRLQAIDDVWRCAHRLLSVATTGALRLVTQWPARLARRQSRAMEG